MFAEGKAFRSITLPDSLTEIGEKALDGCSGLKEITVPANVKTIKTEAFANCSGLVNISLPEGLETVYSYAFENCNVLSEIILPDTINRMGYKVFQNCENLRRVNYPLSLRECPGSLGSYSYERGQIFYNCPQLKDFTIPEGITELPEYIFRDCTGLRNVHFPQSLRKISAYAFNGCIGLPYLSLNNGVETIDASAFRHCDGLISVRLPDTVAALGNEAFAECKNLTDIYLPDSIQKIGDNCFRDSPVCLLVSENSYPLLWAIDHGQSFQFVSYKAKDYSKYVLDMKHSSFYTYTENGLIQNALTMYLNYQVKDEWIDRLDQMKLCIRLAPNVGLVENAVLQNGIAIDTYEYQNNLLTIPVSDYSGKLQLTVRPLSAGKISMYAYMAYQKEGISCNDIIDTIVLDVPVISLEVPENTQESVVQVHGAAQAGEKINLYVDDTLVTNVTVKKNGAYNTSLPLPTLGLNSHTFVIKAALQSDPKVMTTAKIYYDRSLPKLVLFDMYYNQHTDSRIDLLEHRAGATVSIFPGTPITFKIRYENASAIKKVYVVSNKKGAEKQMEAISSGIPGEYIATGYFDESNHSYIPGNLSVRYVLDGGESSDDGPTPPGEDNIIGPMPDDLFLPDAEPTEIDGAKGYTMTLNDADHTEVSVTQSEKIISYSDSQLSSNGFNYVEGSGGQYVKIEIHDFSIEESVYDRITKKLVTTAVSKTESGSALLDIWGFAYDGQIGMLDIAMMKFEIEASGMSPADKAAAYKKLNSVRDYYAANLVISYMFWGVSMAAGIEFPASIAVKVLENFTKQVLLEYYTQEMHGHSPSVWKLIQAEFKNELTTAIKWLIDPSGYVYEAVTANRISDAKVTAYFRETMEDAPVIWDASEYMQENPVYTDSNGIYAWDTPEGFWQVVVEKDGYQSWISDWLPVPPAQTEVYASLVSEAVPEISWIQVYSDHAEVEFSKYMMPETVSNMTLKDAAGKTIDYTLEYEENETSEDGLVYAKQYRARFETVSLAQGDRCDIDFNSKLKSYAGVAMKSTSVSKSCGEQISITAQSNVSLKYGESVKIPVELTGADGVTVADGSSLVSAVSSAEDLVKVISMEKIDTNSWELTLQGRLPGETSIELAVADTAIRMSIDVTILMNPDFEGFEEDRPKPPAAPVLSALSNLSSGVKVTWATVDGADGYYIYRTVYGKDAYELIGTAEVKSADNSSAGSSESSSDSMAAALTLTDTAVKSGTTYTYRVTAYKGKQESENSNAKSYRFLSMPKINEAKNLLSGIELHWDKVTGAAGYYVYRRNTSSESWKQIADLSGNSSVTYTDTTAAEGKTYYYALRAYHKTASGNIYQSSRSSSGTKIVRELPLVLEKPVITAISNLSTGIKLTWSAVANAEGYEIYRTVYGKNSYSKVGTVTKGTTVTYTDKTAENKTSYTYRIHAVAGEVTSEYSSTKTYRFITMPTNIKAENLSTGIKVTWDQVEGATGYYVYRRTSTSEDWTLAKTITAGDTVSYTNTAVKTNYGSTYYYTVRAYYTAASGNIYQSSRSSSGVKVIRENPLVLEKPVISGISNLSTGIKVSWGKVANAEGYEIYRTVYAKNSYSLIGTVTGGNTLNFTDTTALNKTSYTYKIRAIAAGVSSDYSSAKTYRFITMPKITGIINLSGGIKVTWNEIEGATGYYVYRRSSASEDWVLAKTVTDGSIVSYTNTTVKENYGQTFYYTVRAYYTAASGNTYQSSRSTSGAKTVRVRTAGVPTLSNTASGVKVTWKAVEDAAGYYVYRKAENDADYKLVKTVTSPDTLTYTNTSVKNGVSYTYKISAYTTSAGVNYEGAAGSAKTIVRMDQ